jgi:hypothetical protein
MQANQTDNQTVQQTGSGGTVASSALFGGTGGLRKIRDSKPPCLSPSHNPPSHIVLEPGDYEYVCPSCGQRTTFTVPYVTC